MSVKITDSVAAIEEVEMLDYSTGFEMPADPIYRIVVDGYCADFPTRPAAENFRAAFISALSAHTAEKGAAEPDETAIGYALRFGGMCRDCADTRVAGICDHSGMPCDSTVSRKVMTHALKAWQYGVKHGFIANPVEAPPALHGDLVAEATVSAVMDLIEERLAIIWAHPGSREFLEGELRAALSEAKP